MRTAAARRSRLPRPAEQRAHGDPKSMPQSSKPKAPLPKKRRTCAKRARAPACDLCCEHESDPVDCCGKSLCPACVTNLLRVSADAHNEPEWYFTCPFCRGELSVDLPRVKELLAEQCPHHAKLLNSESSAGGSSAAVVAVHLPCNDGCYHCAGSTLRVVSAWAVDERYQEESERYQDEVARLRAENQVLREAMRHARAAHAPAAHHAGPPPH